MIDDCTCLIPGGSSLLIGSRKNRKVYCWAYDYLGPNLIPLGVEAIDPQAYDVRLRDQRMLGCLVAPHND